MDKLSIYNIFQTYGETTVGLNLAKRKMFAIKTDDYRMLSNLQKIKAEKQVFYSLMQKLGIIVSEKQDENVKNVLLFRNRQEVFDSDTFKLMILPTLDCNFNCWYCYETRPKGIMSESIIASTIKLIEKVTSERKNLFLEWYGGEPLLYFDIVKRISETAKELCEKNAVSLYSQITTNGYLIEKDMIPFFKAINMKSFQITLNGSREIHNKIRFQKGTTDSYDKIVSNIILLAQELTPPVLILRINFERSYFDRVTDIISSIPENLRSKIMVYLRQVDQDLPKFTPEEINDKLKIFDIAGFNTKMKSYSCIRKNGVVCRADTFHQANINYDGRIFKCHAIDFEKATEDGILLPSGEIKWNNNILMFRTSLYSIDKELITRSVKLLTLCI
jgi:uncharacterized protein